MPLRAALRAAAVAVAAAVLVACGGDGGTPSATTAATPPPPSVTTSTAVPTVAPPAWFVAAVDAGLDDPRLRGLTVGATFSSEGWEVLDRGAAAETLLPASTQKLATAAAALAVLGPDARLTTSVRATGSVDEGRLRGDLVLVGGGDPSLAATGDHSLESLALQVRQAGIAAVSGRLLGDDSRHDAARRAPGWADRHVPALVGPLSALVVDANRHGTGAAFLADPLAANLALFHEALTAAGVAVSGGAGGRVSADGGARVVAEIASAPVSELVGRLLTGSDNLAAELLLREVGLADRGEGSTAAGAAAVEELLDSLGLPGGVIADGSGVSADNRRAPVAWRVLLEAATLEPWGQYLLDGLAVAGRTGTLANRFQGTGAEGRLRAKTGFVHGALALSGVLERQDGRRVVFSVVVNGASDHVAVQDAVDELLVALTDHGR